MVGILTNSATTPVAFAHNTIRHPGATVDQVLNSLTPPPPHTIPYLTDPAARPGQWVRYIAMVQDIWDTELFVASSPDGQSGLLVENAAASNHPAAVLAERLPVYLVSIPGETTWARIARGDPDIQPHRPTPTTSSATPASQPRLKRSRDDVDMADAREAAERDAAASTVAPVPSPPSAQPSAPSSTNTASPNTGSTSDKRQRPLPSDAIPTSPTVSVGGTPSGAPLGLNVPLRAQRAVSAVVAKLYGASASSLRLNAVIELVGILQEGLSVAGSGDDAFAAELAARNPANVKRVHAVRWRVLDGVDTTQLGLTEEALPAARREAQGAASAVREMLLRSLRAALGGDRLAAEYVLLALLARPVRSSAGLLGKLSVNIVLPANVGDDACAKFVRTIEAVAPALVEVDVSIAGLNAGDLYARKDYELNRLRAGALQIARGAVLVGNETKLSDGRLSERGVRNLRALKLVADRFVAPVDFHYYESEIEVDCAVVLVSKGGKSLVSTDVIVRVQGGPVQDWQPSADELRQMRLGLGLLAEHGEFNISDAVSNEIEATFVEARKEGLAQDGQESLTRWLSVARYCARSFGETSLTSERWRYAMALEKERESRTRN